MKNLFKLLSKEDKILISISWALKFAFLFVLVTSTVKGNILYAGLALLVLIMSFLPSMIKRRFNIISPPEFELIIALFLYASLILGEMNNFYFKFPWWDVMLHGFSAIMIALIGFMIVFSLYYTHKVVFSALVASIFVFSFALSIGALWEILEFAMDSFLKLNMQKSGLIDTMWDLIIDSIGALIVAISGYFYMKGGPSFLMERFVKKYISINQHRFKNKKELV
ncbi:MAG: hypothetical protein ABIB43_01935 [archaeon]